MTGVLKKRWVAPVLLGLLVAGTAIYLGRWSLLNHSWGNDEELYVHFARGMARDFGLFIHMDPSYGRGIQRLHLLLMAVPMALFKNPRAFEIAHAEFVLVYVSAAIPAYLIARGSGLGRYASLVPAALVVLTPWAVVTTSFLAEPVGYGAFAWAIWGIWRAAVKPSIWADLLALVLVVIAMFARTGFLLLLPVLPIVAVLQAWRYGTGDGTAGTRLRALPRAAIARQPVAVGIGVLGAGLLFLAWTGILPGGTNRFTGTYATSLPPLWLMASKWRSFLSRVDAGTGFLLLAVALPWLVARIVRPREPALHAFAWIAFLASFSVLLSLVGGPADERYVMFLGFTVPLAASIALFRRELGPWMALLGGAAAFILFFTPGWHLQPVVDSSYFGFPVESFMSRVVLDKLHDTPSAILLALGLLVVVVLASRPRWRRWLPVVIIPAALFQFVATGYAVKNFVNSVGAHHGPGFLARSWVDSHVPRNENVGLLGISDGLTADYSPIWREVQYWNTTMRTVVKLQSGATNFDTIAVPYPFGTHALTIPFDPVTGRVDMKGQPYPFPRYMVIPQPPLSVILGWDKISTASYMPASLVRITDATQARTLLVGVTPNGYFTKGQPATITVYRAAKPPVSCVMLDVVPQLPDPAHPGNLGFKVTAGGKTIATRQIKDAQLQRVYIPVTFKGATRDIIVSAHGKPDATGQLPLQIGNYEPLSTPCPG